MRASSALLLQAVVVFIGVGTLAFLLWEPHIEGRNVQATTFVMYFKDPFLAYVYVGSIPFFLALYRAFGLFGHVRQTGVFSLTTVAALRAIRRCAIVLIGFVAGAVVVIRLFEDPDDRPAGFFLCLIVAGVSSVVAVAATKFAQYLKNTLGQSALNLS